MISKRLSGTVVIVNTRFNSTIRFVATWFGCGLAPRAPGTMGTIGAVPLVWLLNQAGSMIYLAVTLTFAVGGVLIAQFYEQNISTEHDAPEFVLDEVAGFLITMALVPLTWFNLLVGFALFRVLDVIKPFPISWIDKNVPGGMGAMADDLVAGILASAALQAMLHFGVL